MGRAARSRRKVPSGKPLTLTPPPPASVTMSTNARFVDGTSLKHGAAGAAWATGTWWVKRLPPQIRLYPHGAVTVTSSVAEPVGTVPRS